jgi:2-polyprenyl-3-methyl-5-hydroxy-6-metoxy-1,4-benzoquinol methylase
MLHEDRRIREHREMTKLINEDKISGKLIDIGCGTGGFLDSLDNNKWEKWGVEPAGFAREILIKKNIRALNDTFLNSDLPENYFDVVTMFDVIEHIVDPLAHLRKAWKILKDDGVLLIATPDVDSLTARISGRYWRHFQPIAHVIFYSPYTLSKILKKEGFSDYDIHKYDYSLSFSKAVVNMVKSARKFLAKAVVLKMASIIHTTTGINLLKMLPSFNTVLYLPWFYDFFCIKAQKSNK